jgi:hypothetical protein
MGKWVDSRLVLKWVYMKSKAIILIVITRIMAYY